MPITKPTVGGDVDTWGTVLNTALDNLDGRITNNKQLLDEHTTSINQLLNSSGSTSTEPAIGLPVCKMIALAAQSITSGTTTALTFGRQPTDIWGGAGTDRYTSQRTGIYDIAGAAGFEPNQYGYRALYWYINGTPVDAGSAIYPATGLVQSGNLAGSTVVPARSTWVRLNAGDYLQLYVRQNSGSTLSTAFANDIAADITIRWAGPA